MCRDINWKLCCAWATANVRRCAPCPAFVKSYQFGPWIKDSEKSSYSLLFCLNSCDSCVRWERLSLPHVTKIQNCRDEIIDRAFLSWSLIHKSCWSALIKAGPCLQIEVHCLECQPWITNIQISQCSKVCRTNPQLFLYWNMYVPTDMRFES